MVDQTPPTPFVSLGRRAQSPDFQTPEENICLEGIDPMSPVVQSLLKRRKVQFVNCGTTGGQDWRKSDECISIESLQSPTDDFFLVAPQDIKHASNNPPNDDPTQVGANMAPHKGEIMPNGVDYMNGKAVPIVVIRPRISNARMEVLRAPSAFAFRADGSVQYNFLPIAADGHGLDMNVANKEPEHDDVLKNEFPAGLTFILKPKRSAATINMVAASLA